MASNQGTPENRNYTERDVVLAYSKVHSRFPALPPTLRSSQLKAITATCNGKDLLCVLPTSSGKTIIMATAALVKAVLLCNGESTGNVGTVIILPLTGLLSQMIQLLQGYGLNCYQLISSSLSTGELAIWLKTLQAPYFLFTSAETIFRKGYAEALLKLCSPGHICVDECHVIVEWGIDRDREAAFRRMYSKVSILRCLSEDNISLSLFSATLDMQIVTKLKAVAGLCPENTLEIVEPPYKPNIFFSVRNGKENLDNLSFILDELRHSNIRTKKTIIFVNQVEECRVLYFHFWRQLGKAHRFACTGNQILFAVFNGVSSEEDKQGILMKFSKPDSKLRILIATVSFGMGMDIRDIRRCVLYGAPITAVDAIQKIGRVGRDCERAEAIIYPFTTQFYRSKKGNFLLQDTSCYKVQLICRMYGCRKFRIEHVVHNPICSEIPCNCTQCNCCSYCQSICPCTAKYIH